VELDAVNGLVARVVEVRRCGIGLDLTRLIDAEAATAILSDDTIVERLRDSGIDIARRTVAKYREAMRIPSSVQRRRDKQSMLGNALSAPATSSDRSRDTAPA